MKKHLLAAVLFSACFAAGAENPGEFALGVRGLLGIEGPRSLLLSGEYMLPSRHPGSISFALEAGYSMTLDTVPHPSGTGFTTDWTPGGHVLGIVRLNALLVDGGDWRLGAYAGLGGNYMVYRDLTEEGTFDFFMAYCELGMRFRYKNLEADFSAAMMVPMKAGGPGLAVVYWF